MKCAGWKETCEDHVGNAVFLEDDPEDVEPVELHLELDEDKDHEA